MKSIYILKIYLDDEITGGTVSDILNVSPTEVNDSLWSIEIVENEKDPYIDFVNHFLDILENKYQKLKSIGIDKCNISIWYLYEYDNQCNIEFQPSELKRLGEHEISLCISCWETGSTMEF